MVQTQFGTNIEILRSDNVQEFFTTKLTEYLTNEGFIHQSTCVYTPQQNGVVERKHKHLLGTTRALKLQASLPDCFWGDCI